MLDDVADIFHVVGSAPRLRRKQRIVAVAELLRDRLRDVARLPRYFVWPDAPSIDDAADDVAAGAELLAAVAAADSSP